MSNAPDNEASGRSDKVLTLKVGTPKGAFTADFNKTAKVLDVIEAAIKTKALDGVPGDFEVFHGAEKLEPVNRTLVSFGLKDGDELLVTAQGDGV